MNTEQPTVLNMRVGLRYIVTHSSKHKEFQVGDRIKLCADGGIDNMNARGWMYAKDVPAATRGMLVAVDTEWVVRQREKLAAQMAALHE